jgi:ABC-type Fe3+ transport system substrate-binding protein
MGGKRIIMRTLGTIVAAVGILPAAVAAGAPLDQVIEGAKKEGMVKVRLRSSFTEKSMIRLEKEIKDKFNVDLKIQYTPTGGLSRVLAETIMETKVGAPPSYDLVNFSNHVINAMKAGALERVDWEPLITKDTNPEVVLTNPAFRGVISYYTTFQGLRYQTQKVPADQVPRTLRDLADPRWKGKVGISRSPDAWTRWAFVLGKDKVLSDLRAILKNGAIQGDHSDLQVRYLLGEIWMAFSISSYVKDANEKGVPSKWQGLDLGDAQVYSLSVRKGALHPNAAKLVALYLASPQGSKFTIEESDGGTLFYPGNLENDIRMQNKKQGIREFLVDKNPQIVDFYSGKEFEQWEKEVDIIMKTGGKS